MLDQRFAWGAESTSQQRLAGGYAAITKAATLTDREIKAGKLTEEEAVEQGLLKPPDVGGRPLSKALVRDYLEQKESQRLDKIDQRSGVTPKSAGKKRARKPKDAGDSVNAHDDWLPSKLAIPSPILNAVSRSIVSLIHCRRPF